MTVDALLVNLDAVRQSGRGWVARCPAHSDRHPSLSIREGERGLLVKCWAGCTVDEITAALGHTVRDLFYVASFDRPGRRKTRPKRKPWRFDWRHTAALLEDHALTLQLRAESVLGSAKDLHPSEWSDAERDHAMTIVCRGYENMEWAETLLDTAFDMRVEGLRKEQEQHASRS